MRILVTGGAGYIGSHVVKKLCELDNEVTIFDNLSTGLKENINPKAEFIKGDITNPEDLKQAFSKNYNSVFHFAALKASNESMTNPEKYAKTNISGTINLLSKCSTNNVKNFVFSSSAAVYGTPNYLPIDEKHKLNPENFYGYTKLEIEQTLNWFSKLRNINYASLRYFNAAGYDLDGDIKGKESNPQNLLPIVMEVADGTRKKMCVYGDNYETKDGSCIRDYIHVSDLADAHILAMDYINKGKNLTVNLGSDKGYSVFEVLKEAEKVTEQKINFDVVGRRSGDPAIVYASSKLAEELIGWKAKYSDLRTILMTMWKVYKP